MSFARYDDLGVRIMTNYDFRLPLPALRFRGESFDVAVGTAHTNSVLQAFGSLDMCSIYHAMSNGGAVMVPFSCFAAAELHTA